MSVQETFIRADEELKKVVDQIKDEQWQMEMPEWFDTRDKSKTYSLREIINYHAYDEAWVPDMMAGKTMEKAGKDKFDGDLLGENPKENFAALVDKAVSAVRNLNDLQRTIHFSYGDYPAKEALQHIAVFRGLRVHDIAKVIGINSDLPDDLVQGLWETIKPCAEEWRAMGIFGPEVEVHAEASLQDRLLGLTGRHP